MKSNEKYFCSLERKVSERVIERCNESTPSPNADGTIDYYVENMGKWEGFCSISTNSYEEAESYYKRQYPTIWKEDECRIIVRML
jgi:hypothetical protein